MGINYRLVSSPNWGLGVYQSMGIRIFMVGDFVLSISEKNRLMELNFLWSVYIMNCFKPTFQVYHKYYYSLLIEKTI